MYRKLSLLFWVVFVALNVSAQASTNTGKIAPFVITLADGKTFKAEDLKKQPTVLIYFSPDCDHCKDFTKSMLKNYKGVADKQIVMATYYSIESIKKFITQFDLNKYSNIKVGTEGSSFIVRNYYNVENFPFVALYDKNGKEIKLIPANATIKDILKAMK
jgi:thioredoxin-related protein